MVRQQTKMGGRTLLFLAATTSGLSGCIGQSDERRPEGNFMQPATGGPDGAAAVDAAAPEDTGANERVDASPPVDADSPSHADDGRDAASDAAPDERDAEAQPPATDAGCPGLFCEDFERGVLSPTTWTRIDTDNAANSVSVSGDVVAHGRHAAHFHARGGSSRAFMFNEHLPSALGNHYYGRMNIRIDGFPTENGGHTAYVTSGHSAEGYPYSDDHLEIGHYYSGGAPVWQLTYWTGDGPEYISAGGHVPVGRWFCLEFEFNNAPDQIAVWVDGTSDPNGAAFRNINGGATALLQSLGTLGLGFRTFHPLGAPDTDIYIDDLVLDTARVPCLAP